MWVSAKGLDNSLVELMPGVLAKVGEMSYRPITDTWILARSKVKYYGAYPAGFLGRARALLGVGPDGAVLHVCGGRVRSYPYSGFGCNDKTLDLDPAVEPDFLMDARLALPRPPLGSWAAVLADPPYTEGDAAKYGPGAGVLPSANVILANGLEVVEVGGKVGILHYVWPGVPTVPMWTRESGTPYNFNPRERLPRAKEVAVITVLTGRNNRARLFTVFERLR